MRTNSHGIGTRVLARRAGDPRHLRPHDARVRPGPVDRAGRARAGRTHEGRPGPPPLARRGHAVRAERRGRPEARPGREQPQDRQLPGPFHVERRAVRLHRRLPGRRRPRLPGRPGRLQPARPRRVRRHRRPTSSSPSDGVFRLSITEPMDEVAYLDHLRLDVVDRPPGVSATPDERFAPEGPRPTGELLAWRTQIEPVRADRPRRPRRDRDPPALGPPHRRRLPQARRLDRLRRGARDRPRLRRPAQPVRARPTRWSSAWPAGSSTPTRRPTTPRRRPASRSSRPSIERRRDDGTLGSHRAPRRLSRRLAAADDARPDRQARRPALRAADQDQHGMLLRPGLHRRARPRGRGVAPRDDAARWPGPSLGYRGYTREVSPDGRQPLLYDYDYVDPAPLARFSGKLTRYGDVAELLQDGRRPALPGRARRRGPARVRRAGPARRCPRAGRGATSCGRTATARTPTRSRPPATRSGRSPGAACRRSRSAARSSGPPTRPTRPTSASTRPARPGEGIEGGTDAEVWTNFSSYPANDPHVGRAFQPTSGRRMESPTSIRGNKMEDVGGTWPKGDGQWISQ